MEVIGFRLINSATLEVVSTWGGVVGQCPGVPAAIRLPNGDDLCAPEVDVDYNGFKLIKWFADESQ